MLQVGVGKSGILRVSSGSDNSVNLARNRGPPNAVITNETQHKPKMSESAHAKIGIGKIYCITNTNRLRATRTIGKTQPPCVKPDWWWYPRRNGRGEVIGDVPISVHAQCGKERQMNESANSVQRTIGAVQPSCIAPERQQTPCRNRQGGVVDFGDGFPLPGLGVSRDRTCTHRGGVVSYYQENLFARGCTCTE